MSSMKELQERKERVENSVIVHVHNYVKRGFGSCAIAVFCDPDPNTDYYKHWYQGKWNYVEVAEARKIDSDYQRDCLAPAKETADKMLGGRVGDIERIPGLRIVKGHFHHKVVFSEAGDILESWS
jgi:hypothetical protein